MLVIVFGIIIGWLWIWVVEVTYKLHKKIVFLKT